MSDPTWWSNKGAKMEVDGVVLKKGEHPLINICNGRVAKVVITEHGNRRAEFNVSYTILHVDGGCSSGTVLMDRGDLTRAFGLVDGYGHEGGTLANSGDYDPEAAACGKYFRIGNCLNLPHPGTGLAGDPNVSIQITKEIKSAIQAFLEFTQAKAA